MARVSTKVNKKPEKTKAKITQFLNEFPNQSFNISKTCKLIGIDRKTYYLWIEKYPEFKQGIADAQESILDLAESKLHEYIDRGHPTAIIFYLKTKGQQRGYIETQQTKDITKEPKTIIVKRYSKKKNEGNRS